METQTITVEQTYNLYGGSKKLNYTHMTICRETDKAVMLTTDSSEGSYLREYRIEIWLPKSVFYKYQSHEVYGGINVTLPFYFDITINRIRIR